MVRWGGVLMLLVLAGCGESLPPITDCVAGAGMTPDCRFQNPEDLAVVPGGGRLLVSQMGAMDGSRTGNVALYAPGADIQILFPGESIADDRRWGSPDCPPPALAAFAPHGLDLVQRQDGAWMLLVVNHGGRESIELFELADRDGEISLDWRGCAEGPDQSFFNDVVGRRDGGFFATHMYPRDSQILPLIKGGVFGMATGHVYQWSIEEGSTEEGSAVNGWQVVPGSEGPFPNGIELAADERTLYINMYLAGEVRALDLTSGEIVAVYEGGNPDNSTWASNGQLLVATHIDGLSATTGCMELEEGSCGFAFRIVALDPDDLSSRTILEHRGPPMGAATVALEIDGALYLGTFAGDRIARVAPPG